jgi:ABC-2 type transport system permease protein
VSAGGPAHLLRATPELFRVGFAELVAYRVEMVIWILTATMPLIMLALWNSVVTEAPLEGFGPTEITRYFAATLIVRQLTSAWLLWELNWQIRSGGLSPRLLQPLHPLARALATAIAAMPMRMVVLTPLVAGLVIWRPELLAWPGWAAAGLFTVSCALAFLMTYLIQALFGMLAFWLDQSEGLFGLWMALWMLLSGYIAPLAMFPEAAQRALAWLPFRGMLAVPVELLGGFLAPADALVDVGVQLGWTALLWAAVALTWRAGLKRYGAFGA